MARLIVIGVILVLAVTASTMSSSNADEPEQMEASETADDSETLSSRVARQYNRYRESRPPSSRKPAHPFEDGIVRYDSLGFEIEHHPHKDEPFKLYDPYDEKRPAEHGHGGWIPIKPYHNGEAPVKPFYPEKPYYPDPAPKPYYKPEKPYHSSYPVADGYYDSYYCPKVYELESKCRPVKDCAIWYDLVEATPGTVCKLEDGSPGACCPDLPYNGLYESETNEWMAIT